MTTSTETTSDTPVINPDLLPDQPPKKAGDPNAPQTAQGMLSKEFKDIYATWFTNVLAWEGAVRRGELQDVPPLLQECAEKDFGIQDFVECEGNAHVKLQSSDGRGAQHEICDAMTKRIADAMRTGTISTPKKVPSLRGPAAKALWEIRDQLEAGGLLLRETPYYSHFTGSKPRTKNIYLPSDGPIRTDILTRSDNNCDVQFFLAVLANKLAHEEYRRLAPHLGNRNDTLELMNQFGGPDDDKIDYSLLKAHLEEKTDEYDRAEQAQSA